MTAAIAPAPGAPAARAQRRRHAVRAPLSARYVLQRLATSVVAIWVVLTGVFFALLSTGDPAQLMVSPDAPASQVAKVAALMGFNKPVWEQYLIFLRQLVSGHFPASIVFNEPSLPLVLDRLPASLVLGGTGLVLGVLTGGIVGYIAARSRFAVLRQPPVSALTALDAVPTFFFGVLLIFIFAVHLQLLPAAGGGSLTTLILPAVTLAVVVAAPVARIFRTAMIDTMELDHVRTARAKGIHPAAVMWRHVIVNSLPPVVNVIGVQAGTLLGGAVVTETLFSWPGVGQLSIYAIDNRDYPVVLATVFVIAVGFTLINLAVDLLAAALDPRSRR
ncbi:MAG TPA: ABC transporter permease [Streptosporangiaceae bacterium]|jgi:peptide/nickel transport system permease protein